MDDCALLIEELRSSPLESQRPASEEPADDFLDNSPFSRNYKQAQIEPPKQETGARPKTLLTEKPAEAAQLFPTRSPPEIPKVSAPLPPPLPPREITGCTVKENPHLKRDAELRQSLGATALPNPGLPYPNYVTDEMVRQAVLVYQATHAKTSFQPQLDALGNDPKFENVPLEDLTPKK